MKLLIVCFALISSQCFSQEKVHGTWLTTTYWSCSYTKLKKNGTVRQFTANCKDRGTKRTGKWYQQNDTIYIATENRSAKFLLKENKLCHIDDEGKICDTKYGIPRTNAKTIVGAKRRIKKIRQRD